MFQNIIFYQIVTLILIGVRCDEFSILPDRIAFIQQSLNHFDASGDEYYFYQRFIRNDEFFKPGSPIFVRLSDVVDINIFRYSSSRIYELAKEFNAQLICIEQRFYGESRPIDDTSIENLKYLTPEQMLADVARLIVELKKEPGKEKSPVVIIGNGKTGALAVWFRQRYPELAVGVWASSVPLLAKVNFAEYAEDIARTFRRADQRKCYDVIRGGIQTAEQLINLHRYEEFVETLNFCPQFNGDSAQDVAEAFKSIAQRWFGTVIMYSPRMLEIECDFLLAWQHQNLTDFKTLGKWLENTLALKSHHCTDINYAREIESLRKTSWLSERNLDNKRQWAYQACTQFGWYESSNGLDQPFGTKFSVNTFYKFCADLFDYSPFYVAAKIEQTNWKFGGLKANVTNVFYTHGERDPYRLLGIQSTAAAGSDAIVIKNARPSEDFIRLYEGDSIELRTAKLRIAELIKEWIQ